MVNNRNFPTGLFDFTNMEVKETVYNWHDLQNLDYISIMLQTGYLTFKEPVAEFIYKIGFPNREVEQSFSELLLERHLHKQEGRLKKNSLENRCFQGC